MPIPNDDDTGTPGTGYNPGGTVPTGPGTYNPAGTVPTIPGTYNPAGTIPTITGNYNPAATFGNTLSDPSLWFRIGIGALGVALIIAGTVILFRRPIAAVAVPEAGALKAAATIVKG